MKSFFLLVLSLMLTGCEASSEVRGCPEGWVEFTCECPRTCDSIVVVDPTGTPKRSTKKDVWETKGRISLYHDTKTKKLKVAIRQLQRKNFGQYRCKFYQEPKTLLDTEELHLVDERDGCQGPFLQNAYRAAKTTITCDYEGNKNESGVMFFCKENKKTICEDILSTKYSSMSISDVSSHHAGVYWCGLKSTDGSYRTALRKIQLEVKDINKFTRSPTAGQAFTYWCKYPNGAPIKKFICKGEDPSICHRLVSTAQHNMTTGKFSMKDDKVKRNITITVREVTTDDAGTYWCGAESADNKHSNPFFSTLVMTVVPPPPVSTIPSATSSPSSVQPVSYGGLDQTSVLIIAAALSLDVLLLLLMLAAYFVYTRYETWKNTRRGA